MYPQRKVDISWSPDFAYAIGLLTADGNLSKDGRHLDFTSKDKELVRLFKECLNLDNKIGTKYSTSKPEKDYYRVQFGDIVFYKWLESIGLEPNKSDKLGEIDVPADYFLDFVRGYFDGDGSYNSYWDKRWSNSFMFYTKFSAVSKGFIKWLRLALKNKLKIRGSTECYKYKRKSWNDRYLLKYAKTETKIFVKNIYYKDNLPCLSRKKKKINKILATERNC